MAALPTHLSQGASDIKDTCLRLVRQQLHLRSKPPRASPRPLLVPTEPEPIDPMVTPGPPLSLMMRCLHSGPSQSSGVIVAFTATNCSIPSSVFSLNCEDPTLLASLTALCLNLEILWWPRVLLDCFCPWRCGPATPAC